ncbi:DUF6973 domain-containing protein [Neisseria sp. DTU_2021_1001991_1_SI_NGA_ILE_055]|jgi:hypothetical protein|uniref:DUF6973 domain-containing protein n=1 Tax=Neisseria sp. DTU_2021_1001991_1_SI_NGA_ILE_055 TaxID=3077590 RepID=UPI001CB36914|nr:hypothetical protein [Neisseria sp. DTU_2021_1001991_1_SI_NGA_ILE_055]MBF1278897.1 hypothetical protein [Neisseria lactamica]WNS84281.1 hypothetical protein RRV97_03900 [Neisseria sp. DTU_2021_1001991_1_SI_NGA_ILE_055]
MKHIKKHIQCAVLGMLVLSGCQSYQEDQSRRSKMAQFALNHPVAAQVIGMEDEGLINMTSNATRFAERTGLDDKANGDSRGTQVNAVRQALWQAAIASKFDSIIAEKAGNARLTDMELREGKDDYFSRYLADQAVDQRNNRIGRSIGSAKPDSDMKTLAASILFYYNKVGLWTASEVNNRWHIKQEKLSDGQYAEALKNIAKLDQNGMTEQERNSYKTGTLSEIKRSVKAIRQVED